MGADNTPPQTPGEVAAAVHRPGHLTHDAALVACEAASKKSAEIGVPMNIAIVDASLVSRLRSSPVIGNTCCISFISTLLSTTLLCWRSTSPHDWLWTRPLWMQRARLVFLSETSAHSVFNMDQDANGPTSPAQGQTKP